MAIAHAIPDWLNALPFIASLFAFGMPHGAADGAVAWRWARARSASRRVWIGFVAAYTLVIALTIAALIARPALALLVFLLLSVLHFGLAADRMYRSDNRVSGVLTAGVVVLLPFATQPRTTREIFSDAAALLGDAPFPMAYAQLLAGAACTSVVGLLIHSTARAIAAQRITTAATVRPLALLGAASVTHLFLPPLMGVGIWFLLWHAAPELLRVARESRPGLRTRAAIAHGHALSLPLLIPTLVALACTIGLAGSVETARDLALWSIIAYAAVTPGHVLFQEAAAANGRARLILVA
jgi:Brp/Blh family beta-carotene 15,15'-monooxygenase